MGMNKDQVSGRIRATKGRVEEAAGSLVGSRRLRAKGKIQGAIGVAQAKFGDTKSTIERCFKKAGSGPV